MKAIVQDAPVKNPLQRRASKTLLRNLCAEGIAQTKLEAMISDGPRARRFSAAQRAITESSRVAAQRKHIQSHFGPALDTAQRTEDAPANATGMPNHLKAGLERISGMDLSQVRVHSNSPKPAQLNAQAYAQGPNIYLGPGQERHLPHEAWHTVQQMQGRVRPTIQAHGVPVNNDRGLETEADVMGARAAQLGGKSVQMKGDGRTKTGGGRTVQFTPLEGFGIEGVDHAVMSNGVYASWRKTAQCKFAPHGAVRFGDQMLVTQYRDASTVLQMAGGDKARAWMIIGEGTLTLLGAIAVLAISHGTAFLAAIPAAAVGISKIIRGSLMLRNKYPKLQEALRLSEGLIGLAGGAAHGHIGVILFGVAKTLRSILIILENHSDWLKKQKEDKPALAKGISVIKTLLHLVEAGSLAVSGIHGAVTSGGEASKIVGSVVGMGVGTSKGARIASAFGTPPSTKEEREPLLSGTPKTNYGT